MRAARSNYATRHDCGPDDQLDNTRTPEELGGAYPGLRRTTPMASSRVDRVKGARSGAGAARGHRLPFRTTPPTLHSACNCSWRDSSYVFAARVILTLRLSCFC
jgi:hypothetical protein